MKNRVIWREIIRHRQGSVDIFEHMSVKLEIGSFLYCVLPVICAVTVVNEKQQYFLYQKMQTDAMRKKEIASMNGGESTKQLRFTYGYYFLQDPSFRSTRNLIDIFICSFLDIIPRILITTRNDRFYLSLCIYLLRLSKVCCCWLV